MATTNTIILSDVSGTRRISQACKFILLVSLFFVASTSLITFISFQFPITSFFDPAVLSFSSLATSKEQKDLEKIVAHHEASSSEEVVELAATPPRGWNSYDAFAWVVREDEFLECAEIVSRRLLKYGYEYVVIDALWFRRYNNYYDFYSFDLDVVDSYGRFLPDPNRWPSSKGGNGFKAIAKKVHDMGLKFGIHVMRGMSPKILNASMPILDVSTGKAYEEYGRRWNASDIGIREETCRWNYGFISVNTNLKAGKAYLRSLYAQYAEWDVDFIKLDCVFGGDYNEGEIIAVSEILQELDRPMLFSVSPGGEVNRDMANVAKSRTNMFRVNTDYWDSWICLRDAFNLVSDLGDLIGAKGLRGRSWIDLDMLPFGWIRDPTWWQHESRLNLDEQKTQMTLWSIVRSPLFFAGDPRRSSITTFELITNPTLLEINKYSENNMEFSYIASRLDDREHRENLNKSSSMQMRLNDTATLKNSHPGRNVEDEKGYASEEESRAWIATGRRGEVYVALFNLRPNNTIMSTRIEDVTMALPKDFSRNTSYKVKEIWTKKHVDVVDGILTTPVPSHGCALFTLESL